MEEIIIIRTSELEDSIFQDLMDLLKDKKIDIINSGGETFKVLSFPDLKIDCTFRKVICRGQEIKLTASEYHLLVYLAGFPERIYTKAQIYEEVFPRKEADDIDNSIYCLIKSLRSKIEENPRKPKYIQTVRGIGYRFGRNE